MQLKLLIDGIVRQTTVLLAELSTSSGARAPLAHVADQVFVELAREIESQGVGRQVVAIVDACVDEGCGCDGEPVNVCGASRPYRYRGPCIDEGAD